jgi:hypothetical protein
MSIWDPLFKKAQEKIDQMAEDQRIVQENSQSYQQIFRQQFYLTLLAILVLIIVFLYNRQLVWPILFVMLSLWIMAEGYTTKETGFSRGGNWGFKYYRPVEGEEAVERGLRQMIVGFVLLLLSSWWLMGNLASPR